MSEYAWFAPQTVQGEYKRGTEFKNNFGAKGMYEQNRINERFYAGDQWHGASVGADRPLVRYNIIKRIGEYKQAVIGSSPVSVNFSVEGVPNTVALQGDVRRMREEIAAHPVGGLSEIPHMGDDRVPTTEEVNLVMSAMSDFFRVQAERLQLDDKKETLTPSKPKLSTTARKNSHFFPTLSNKSKDKSGRKIFKTIEGNPAPEPISATRAPSENKSIPAALSKKCL